MIQLPALVVLLACSAFFSSSEVALFSLSPLQLRRLDQTHPQAAQLLRAILHPPTRLLSTILIGNTFVNVGLSVLGYAIIVRLLPIAGEWTAVLIMTLVLLVFGEVVPKRIAFLWPERMALLYAWPLTLIMRGLTPLRIGLEHITHQFQHFFKPRGRTLSGDELETVVELSGEEGILRDTERDMLKSILRLEDLQARDVMTPRVDLVGYDLNDGEHELATIAKQAKVRQLPIYRGSFDQIEGLLDVRRFLLDPHHRLQSALSPPAYEPESAPLDQLLTRFLSDRRRTAIVVDEYGGTAGIITRGDIIEEITGDIDDEHGDHKQLFETAGTNRWMLDGQISLEQINQQLGTRLEAEGVDRLAGWIAAQLERMPRTGDQVIAQGCRAVVRQMRRHRITLVLLERQAPTTKQESES